MRLLPHETHGSGSTARAVAAAIALQAERAKRGELMVAVHDHLRRLLILVKLHGRHADPSGAHAAVMWLGCMLLWVHKGGLQ